MCIELFLVFIFERKLFFFGFCLVRFMEIEVVKVRVCEVNLIDL